VALKTRDKASTGGISPNRRGREDKCSSGQKFLTRTRRKRRRNKERLIYNGCG